MSRRAFVTLATDDGYAMGALVLAESLHKAATAQQLVVLITDAVSSEVRQQLSEAFHHVYVTSELCSHDDLALSLLGRPELGITFTKLHCWRLTQYQKCVFLDADTLVLQNCDELFDKEELSAIPDTGWPDCFNSGVFVFRPSLETYVKLVSLAATKGSFDGGDQGLLNTYFSSWRSDLSRRLPFVYNVVSSLSYTYAPAYMHFASGVKIVHFAGSQKPWMVRWRTDTGNVEKAPNVQDLQMPIIKMWIDIFREKVLPQLPKMAKTFVYHSTTTTVVQILHHMKGLHDKSSETYAQVKEADWYFQTEWPMPEVVQQTGIPPPPPSWQPVHYQNPSIPMAAASQDLFLFQSLSTPTPPQSSHESSLHVVPTAITPQPWHEQTTRYDLPVPSQPSSLPESLHHDLSHSMSTHEPALYAAPPQSNAPVESAPHHDYESLHPDDVSEPQYEESPSGLGDRRMVVEEPADPHWEALLWHTVQSPWEPPEMPPASDYPPPPSQSHTEEATLKPTFGWFSEHSGATPHSEASAKQSGVRLEHGLPSLSHPDDGELYESMSMTNRLRNETTSEPREFDGESFIEQSTEAESESAENEDSSMKRMRSWEEGNIDYLGKDRFENIWKKLERMFLDPEPESQVEELTEGLKEGSGNSMKYDGSVAASLLNEERTAVPEQDFFVEEPEDFWPGYPEGDFTGMVDWQEGRIDYCGRDRSDNIMRRIDLIISGDVVPII